MNDPAKWYNAVVRDCGLSAKTFQLSQGNLPVGNVSTLLWDIFDSIPPDSFENYDPAQGNQFSANYGAIISVLKDSPLVQAAMQAWLAAGGFTKVKAYSKTIADLTSVLANAPSKTVKIDLDTPDRRTLQASGRRQTTRRPRPLSLLLPLQGRVENVNGPPSSPGAVEVQFARLLVFAAGPLAKENPLNPDLKDYTPSYNSAALKMAPQDPDAWLDHRWGAFLNIQSGSMLRCCTSLVVVDGVRTVTRPKPIAALAARRNGGAPAATRSFLALALDIRSSSRRPHEGTDNASEG